MKRHGMSKGEEDRRRRQRAESELIKGVTAKTMKETAADLAAITTTYTNAANIWTTAYYQFLGGIPWASPSNPAASPSSPNPNPYIWTPNVTTTANGNVVQWNRSASPAYPVLIGSPTPSPPKRKLPVRRVDSPVVGYRSWMVDFPSETKAVIRSTGVSYVWRGARVRAKCVASLIYGNTRRLSHRAPHEECTCGIHAYKHVANIGAASGEILGAVLTWGKHVEHGQEGYRAANARVIAFAAPSRTGMDFKTWLVRDALVNAAAERLGVRVVPQERLELYAREFGEPLD